MDTTPGTPSGTPPAPPDTQKGEPIPLQLRGETIAFAVQNSMSHIAANVYEPYINYRVQKFYSGHHPGRQFGNYTQNFWGEFTGDLLGSSSLIVSELLFPKQLHRFMRAARSKIDPLYESIAHAVFAKDRKEPDYERKIERWKTFQERNLVRSLIIGTAGIVSNVAVQKGVLKNPSPTHVVFEGKLLSTMVTVALGLSSRFAFPGHMKKVDSWMAENIFVPLMTGDKEEATQMLPAGYADKVLNQRSENSLFPAR